MCGFCTAAAPEGPDGCGGSDQTDKPAPSCAERAIRSAKDQEGAVQRAFGLTAGQIPRHVAPYEEAAKRHDKGRDREIADHPTLEGSDQSAHGEACDDGDRPCHRVVQTKAKRTWQPFGLDHRHNGGTGRQQSTDREVNVAIDDHKDHARGHDGHRHCLDRQIKNVARC